MQKKTRIRNFFLKLSFFSYFASGKHVKIQYFLKFRSRSRNLAQSAENQDFSPKNQSFQNFSRSEHIYVKTSGGSNGIIFSPI